MRLRLLHLAAPRSSPLRLPGAPPRGGGVLVLSLAGAVAARATGSCVWSRPRLRPPRRAGAAIGPPTLDLAPAGPLARRRERRARGRRWSPAACRGTSTPTSTPPPPGCWWPRAATSWSPWGRAAAGPSPPRRPARRGPPAGPRPHRALRGIGRTWWSSTRPAAARTSRTATALRGGRLPAAGRAVVHEGAGRQRAGGLAAPRAVRHPIPGRVAYHSPCHLGHAQGSTSRRGRCCAPSPGSSSSRSPTATSAAAAPASTTWCRSRPPTSWGRARRARAGHRCAVSRQRQPRLHVADPEGAAREGASVQAAHPIEILDASIQGEAVPGRRG